MENNIPKITLIWYGSLLNPDTHHNNHDYTPVIFHGFKRKYNLPSIPKNITPEWEKFMKQYIKRYPISFEEYVQNNYCVLNCEYTGNCDDIVNGLAVQIDKSEFYEYALREEKYHLCEAQYQNICPQNGKVSKNTHTWYVLVAKKWETTEDGKIFELYHNATRNGAYEIWEYFWKLFDKTTIK